MCFCFVGFVVVKNLVVVLRWMILFLYICILVDFKSCYVFWSYGIYYSSISFVDVGEFGFECLMLCFSWLYYCFCGRIFGFELKEEVSYLFEIF